MPMNAEPDDVFEGKRRELTSGAGVAQGCRAGMSRRDVTRRDRGPASSGDVGRWVSKPDINDYCTRRATPVSSAISRIGFVAARRGIVSNTAGPLLRTSRHSLLGFVIARSGNSTANDRRERGTGRVGK